MKRIILLIMIFCFSHANAQDISCKIERSTGNTSTGIYIMNGMALWTTNKTNLILQVKPKGTIVTRVSIEYVLGNQEGTSEQYTMQPNSQYSDSEWDGFSSSITIAPPSLSVHSMIFNFSYQAGQWFPEDQRFVLIRGVPGNTSLPEVRVARLAHETVSEASVNINEIINVPDLASGEEHIIQIGTAGDFTLTGGGNVTIKAASGTETGTLADPFKTSHSGVTVAMNNNGTIAPNEDITATVRVAPDAASGPYSLNLVATANCP